MFSIVATETSVLTFVSIPGLAYRSDWFFLQLAMGYILGRTLVAYYLIPLYFEKDIISIYELVGNRFGAIVQKCASGVFLITRVLADGVRFLATAVIVQVITGWPIWIAVLIIGLVTLIYTLWGGMRAILWIDSIQFLIYLTGGLLIILFILTSSSFPGWDTILAGSKMKIFRFTTDNIFKDSWYVLSAFLGGVFLSFASHGADYMMAQRILTCSNIRDARRAMIGSGFFVFIQFAIFLLAGTLIWAYLGELELAKDRELSYFIINHLPAGIRGILLIGVLSAAMSTLSSSINSLASSTIHDWMKSNVTLAKSILVSGIWALILIIIALIFDEGDTAIVIIGLKIGSFTYGGLLSFFILLKSNKQFTKGSIITGLFCGVGSVFLLQSQGFAWTWFIIFSLIINLGVVYLLSTNKIKIFSFMAFLFICMSCNNSFHTPYKSGLDVLFNTDLSTIKEKKIGIVTNHTAINKEGEHLVKLAHKVNLNIGAIFSPEHGFLGSGEAGEYLSNDIEPLTGARIYSLYGKVKKPSKDMLNGIDLLLFDMQDIGVRYYTYLSTLTLVMESAAENNIPIIILDRLNPLGSGIRGPLLNVDYSSFIGMHPIPISHGMTIGELAIMLNEEGWLNKSLKAQLEIVKYAGYPNIKDRQGAFNIHPSPNMPNLETAWNYQGVCLLEGTNISEGRGTEFPFRMIGAPWIDNKKLFPKILSFSSEGDSISLISFKPKSIIGKANNPKYKDIECNGFFIHNLVDPISWTINFINLVSKVYSSEFIFFQSNFIDKLYGLNQLRLDTGNDAKIKKIINDQSLDQESFNSLRKGYLIYN